jgi:hypothetical protein
MGRHGLVLVLALALGVIGVGEASAQGWGQPQPQPQQQSWGGGRQPIRNLFIGAGVGFGVTFTGGQAFFRAEESVGYHLLNIDEHPGLWIAFTFGQAVAQITGLTFAGGVGFDGTAWQNDQVRITITPSLRLGGVVAFGFGQAAGGFYLSPGLEGAVTIANGFLSIWFRPLAFDIAIRDGGGASYVMLAGANINLL